MGRPFISLLRSRCYSAAPSLLSTFVLLSLLSFLLYFMHSMQTFRRRIQVQSKMPRSLAFNPAVVTMSDGKFQFCMLQLVRSLRKFGWRHMIFLLATDYGQFDPEVIRELDIHGVFVVHTNPIFDNWILKKVNGTNFRQLDARKFRKMELFVNPIFRTFDRLIYMDSDGVIASDVSPMLRVEFKRNETLLMRQNDKSVRKGSLWDNELSLKDLPFELKEELRLKFPDRDIAGGSCWFVVNTPRLPSPTIVMKRSLEILCKYRAAFKLNDQTLLNLLFYNSISMFPWCSWDEVIVENDPLRLRQYCRKHMHLQRWLAGQISFMFRHMSVKEKARCIRENEITRRDLGPPSRPIHTLKDKISISISKEPKCLAGLNLWKRRSMA